MKYTVIWKPEAERRLTQLWLSATDRGAIVTASHRIDQQLGTDPDQKGESRSSGRRVLLEPPLGVIFQVEPDDRIARVLTVWYYQ